MNPSSGLSGLLHLVEHRTRLTVSVVLTTDRLFWLEGPLSVRLLEPPHILPHVRNALYFPNCNDTAWTGHLKFKIGIVWYYIKTSEGHSLE